MILQVKKTSPGRSTKLATRSFFNLWEELEELRLLPSADIKLERSNLKTSKFSKGSPEAVGSPVEFRAESLFPESNPTPIIKNESRTSFLIFLIL